MIQGVFQHRSGRVIALGRLVLAAVFLLAIRLDPTQPSHFEDATYPILAAYLAWTAVYLLMTWDDWWLERRLAVAAHVVDIAMFGVMVYLTEGYTSPFFTFFAFILLSATIKWGWRETAMTAVAVTLLFLGAGLAAVNWGTGELEVVRLLFRSTYLVVLSLVLIWFDVSLRGFRAARSAAVELIDPDRPADPPIEKAMSLAADRLGAKRVLFAWWDREEPWFLVAELDAAGIREQKVGPGESGSLVAPDLENAPFIFDLRRGRILRSGADGRRKLVRNRDSIDRDFASRFRMTSGVGVPVRSDLFEGMLFLLDVPGLCADDLDLADVLSAEITSALERTSAIALFEETSATRMRLALTRDLHDSVVQLLAGTSYRLEGIRKAGRAGRDIEEDIDALQLELDSEQRDLRAFIARLRRESAVGALPELAEALRTLTDRLARQWGISCELLHCPERLRPPEPMSHALRQLMREAVANAVRHGKATRVSATVEAGEAGLSLVIADNGSGFADDKVEAAIKPWSLHERVQELGGTLSLYSTGQGSRVIVSLPYGGAA
jgi:signal transduction histidine kinase